MTLTEEQIQSNLKAYEHAMRTGSKKDIDTKMDNEGLMWMNAEGVAFHSTWIYRIRPTPRLRQWKPEEVPQYALIRRKDHQGEPCEVIMLPEKGYVKDSFSTVYVESGLILYGTCSQIS